MNPRGTMIARLPEDELLDRALRGSVGGRLVATMDSATTAAWASSASRSRLSTFAVGWRAVPAATRVRLIALVGAIAVIVHRAMAPLGPKEPLGAVLPLAILAACALGALLAGPMSRALERIAR